MSPKRLFALFALASASACHGGEPTGTERSEDPMTGAWRLGSSRVYFHASGVLDDDGRRLFGDDRLGWDRLGGRLVLEQRPGDLPDAATSMTLAEHHHTCADGPCVELSWNNGALTLLRADHVIVDDASTGGHGSPCDAGQ